jgi:hypothetical protein
MKFIFFSFLVIFLSSCIFDDSPIVSWNEEEHRQNIILESANHLAFPDLIKYKDSWYVVYRESDAHVNGSFSKINVLKSNDFVNWFECNTYEKKGWDLRDPKFSLNDKNDHLYLHIHAANEAGTNDLKYATIRENYYIKFDRRYNRFEEFETKKLINHKGYFNYWLWRPYWFENNLYVSGYLGMNNIFYKYNSIDSNPVIINRIEGYNFGETTFRVYNNRLYFLSRRINDTVFGSLTIDMDSINKITEPTIVSKEVEIFQIGQLGGPNMVICDSIVYIGGRSRIKDIDRTAIYKYSLINKKIELLYTLESYGDNSYPGMYLIDNIIYGVYYTQNKNFNGFEIRSFKIAVNGI